MYKTWSMYKTEIHYPLRLQKGKGYSIVKYKKAWYNVNLNNDVLTFTEALQNLS